MSSFEEPDKLSKRASQKAKESGEAELKEGVICAKADVLVRMQRAGITADNAWMFFSTYRSVNDFPLLPDNSVIETFVIKRLVNIPTNTTTGVVIRPSVRIFQVERIYVNGGVENIIKDVTADENDDMQYLIDLAFVANDNEEGGMLDSSVEAKKEELAGIRPVTSLPQLVDGKIQFGFNHLRRTTPHFNFGDEENVAPFGVCKDLADAQYSLEVFNELFGCVKDEEPAASGSL